MTLLQLLRSLQAIPAEYGGASVYIEIHGANCEPTAVYLFTAPPGERDPHSSVWITDETEPPSNCGPNLIIVPGKIVR